jgi:hypothetical protein
MTLGRREAEAEKKNQLLLRRAGLMIVATGPASKPARRKMILKKDPAT